ncbi:glycosyltransferase family 1 protein [Fibrobacter sp.]|uniref:glycosyltransferase family 1 protein n=1 Tax=Fibrobacter sp. TaxID=35828 RepID=UPI0025C502D4|nr:glycosyltransferase family 1 protein [Fibrobacter sp.]MBR3071934.1 glycosyltransferase family 1 protein [Fibrobacter sp.]
MSESIRILHMIGSLNVGGSQAMIINLHKAIDKSKVQFDYIVDHPDQLYYESVVKELGGKIYCMPTFKGYNLFEIRKAWKQFFKDHPEYKILHSHVRSYASLYLPIAKNAGLKTIIHSHNTSSGKGLKAVVKFCLQRGLRKNVDYYFACSDVAGKWLFGEEITKQSNYHVLNNAIDVEKYAYSEMSRKKIRDEFNLKNELVVGHVGRFHPQKNHSFLVDIFAEIHKKRPDSVLMLVGTGDLMDSVKEKAAELKLDDSVIFTGSRADVNELLSAFDVFVFPSLFEGLPVTLVEVQAAGLPCFSSDTVTKEVDFDRKINYISLDKDAAYWADEIINGKPERLDHTEAIRKAGYDIQYTVKELTSFYQKLAGS